MNILKTVILFIILLATSLGYAQTAYQHISDENIYWFIDDLASLQLIEANSAVKPYSREQIAKWLTQADTQKVQLSKPQQARLRIFMQEYALEAGHLKTGKVTLFEKDSSVSLHLLPPEVTYRDSQFRALIRPVYGIRYFGSTNEKFYQSYGGLEGIAYVGSKWSGYASLRDNHNSFEHLANPTYFTQEPGGNYKEGNDYSEMRGGLTYTWKWGNFGLLKDHLQWGDANNGSNILSGHTPSFAMIKLHLEPVKWLEFEYFHGWLISQVIDSANSYATSNGYRVVYRQKYMAANMFTFKPFKRLNVSVGNSIIYSDVPVQPAYLVPFLFYKSVDHTLNSGIENSNSQVFFNISSRQIKYVHLFVSIFVDEFNSKRVTDPKRTNFVSYKGGFSVTGWPVKDLSFATEFTRTTPLTYKHRIPATTYESNLYNLGHYLRDNSQDFYAMVRYSPWRTLQLKASYLVAVHGNEYQYDVTGPVPVDEFPVLKDKTWTNNTFSFRTEMLPFTNIRVFAEYSYSKIIGYAVDGKSAQDYEDWYTAKYLHGKTNTLIVGFGIGF